jgi:hypothetical protein
MSSAAVTIVLREEDLAALDRHIAAHGHDRSRADVVAEIVSLWTAGQGGHASPPDEGLRPEDLNASNDS